MQKIVGLALILAGLIIGFFGIPSIVNNNSPDAILNNLKSGNEKAVTEKVSEIAETSTVQYEYSNAVNLSENDLFINPLKLPFATKTIVMMYDGVMKLGADASKMEVSIDKGTSGNVKSITVKCPPVEITSHEIDRDSIQIIAKDTIFKQQKASDYDEAEKKGRSEIEKAVKTSGAMKEAEQYLKDSISGFLLGLYGEDVAIKFEQL